MIPVNNKTKLLGIIGYPLGHTLSPYIHNTWLQALGLNALYLVFEHKPERFKQFIRSLKTLSVCGFNVTLPYKQKIMAHLDIIDDEALKIGAVNTVVLKQGKYIGYNTDVFGFYQSLRSAFPGWSVKGKRVLLLGAGGASLAVAFSLLSHNAELTITNRTVSKARKLKKKLSEIFKEKISILELNKEILRKNNNFDLIINTTSYGLKNEKTDLVSLDTADKKTKIYDIIYGRKTPLLRSAEKNGLLYTDGLMMLVYQAERAFRLWGFPKPDIDLLYF